MYKYIRGMLGFFKMPCQIALGIYAGFMMVAATVAIIEHFVEDFDHCKELQT